MRQRSPLPDSLTRMRERLGHQLTETQVRERDAQAGSRQLRIRFAACAIIFLVALTVRFLHWADYHAEIERGTTLLTTLVKPYIREAKQITEAGGLLLPKTSGESADERLLVHPPGYGILLRALYGDREPDDSYSRLRLLQVLADAMAAAAIFLIASELVPMGAAIIAGLLAGLSPHFSLYSLHLSPESLAALPVLLGIYLIAKSSKRPNLLLIAVAGTMIGASCWLRANALLMTPVLALVIFVSFKPGKRLRYAAVLLAATLITISPITIRNWSVYHRFVPLSIGSGITLIEGIADYDEQKRFNMPASDREVARMEGETYGEEYGGNLWTPRGIERDRARFARGVEVIRAEPVWFLGVMFRRAAFMLRYNDSGASHWPLNTRLAPYVSAQAPFKHPLGDTHQMQPLWSSLPGELLAGATISPKTEVTVADDGEILQVRGSTAGYDDNFVSRPIEVEPNTDYLLTADFRLENGDAAAKVTSSDTRVSLGSVILAVAEAEERKTDKRKRKKEVALGEVAEVDASLRSLRIPFASGNNSHVRFVLSNDGAVPAMLAVGSVEILRAGPTPLQWTRYPRALIRGFQKNLFVTHRMLPLIVIGAALLAVGGRGRQLAILLAVPLYYMSVQSALHTEYRYILAMHYCLFALAAVTIWSIGVAGKSAFGVVFKRFRSPKLKPEG